MSLSVGIVGLPNVGKSTLFKALTKKEAEISPRPFTTIQPNLGHVPIRDERLEKIAHLIKPKKVTFATIEFIDIAGLLKGAHKGEGLGNQFLSHIKNCEAILMVIRGFEDPKVENVLGEVNPSKEIEILKTELLMKDLETLENAISKIEKKARLKEKVAQKKFSLLEKIKESVSRGKLISEIELSEEEKREIREYCFLTEKPMVFLLNTDQSLAKPDFIDLVMNLKEELDISELSEKDKKELGLFSRLDQLILKCYNVLDLITFFTVAGGKEVKAWTLKRGKKAIDSAEKVHSDFKERFIKAEVLAWGKLIEAGSWQKAKEKGFVQIVGKDYIIQDGDIIEFKI